MLRHLNGKTAPFGWATKIAWDVERVALPLERFLRLERSGPRLLEKTPSERVQLRILLNLDDDAAARRLVRCFHHLVDEEYEKIDRWALRSAAGPTVGSSAAARAAIGSEGRLSGTHSR